MKYKCQQCEHIHEVSDALEEAELNGASVQDYCPECEETTRFEMDVAEL